jgi:hypothetical protein
MSTKRLRTATISTANMPDLPLCINFNILNNLECDFNERISIIKKINIRQSASKNIKDIFKNPHNLKLIEEQLLLQNIIVEQYYKISSNYQEILNSWLKLIMLHHLKFHVYTRLANGEYGVRIKAIRDIPKDTILFQTTSGKCTNYDPINITLSEVNDFNIDEGTKNILDDFYLYLTENNITYPIPALGPNIIDLSFFLNHDCNGNISIISDDNCDMSSYMNIRKIKKCETLTINYVEFAKNYNGEININKLNNLVNRMPFLVNLEPFKDQFNFIDNKYVLKTNNFNYNCKSISYKENC